MASFKTAMDFVEHLRLHHGRGRVAVNQTQLAKSLECSTSTLGAWIERLMEAKIINRSPDKGPDGFDYWFTDDYRKEMMSVCWQESLSFALKIYTVGSSKLTVKQRFDVLNNLSRSMRNGIEQEFEELTKALSQKDQLIEQLKKENSDLSSQLNEISFKMRDLEAANREVTATANLYEQQLATLKNELETLKNNLKLSDPSLVASLIGN